MPTVNFFIGDSETADPSGRAAKIGAAGIETVEAGGDSGEAGRWSEHIFAALDREGEGVTRRALGVGMQTLMNSPRRPDKGGAGRAPRRAGASARAEAERLEAVCRSAEMVFIQA